MQKTNLTFEDLNNGFVVAINIEAKPGEGEAVGRILESLVVPTMTEPGVKLFVPYRSPESDRRFFLFELYTDEGAWAAHQQTAHFKAAIADLVPRVAKRERVPFVPYIAV